MPKGQKIVDWTKAENEKKLLHAIVMTSDVSADKVAEVFGTIPRFISIDLPSNVNEGGGVPAKCISTRLATIRKEARGKGVTSTSTASIRAPTHRRPVYASAAAGNPTRRALRDASDETDEDVGMKLDSEDGMTASQEAAKGRNKVITGRVTKSRKSPRQHSVPKNYERMLDPLSDFADVVDEDGDAIFPRQAITPEDSLDSDKEYKDEGSTAGVSAMPVYREA
ncbi:MAG: hypothetical protein Q9209_001290 [Squamulea sp. 1 TL-2023]